MEKKEKKRNKKLSVIFIVLMVLCFGVLCFAVYQALSIYIPQQKEQNRFSELRDLITALPDDAAVTGDDDASSSDGSQQEGDASQAVQYDYSKLAALNPDFSGWLRIDDTVIDYPVMKSSDDDPEYYLHRDFDGYYSFSGCLFLGEHCTAASDIFVIYGHNMNNGSMFGNLDSYRYNDWAGEHSEIFFDTPNEHRVYRVFAAFPTQVFDEESDAFKYYNAVGNHTQEEYAEIVGQLQAMSVIDIGNAPTYPAQIMMLSTCAYHTEDGRFVVAAYRVK